MYDREASNKPPNEKLCWSSRSMCCKRNKVALFSLLSMHATRLVFILVLCCIWTPTCGAVWPKPLKEVSDFHHASSCPVQTYYILLLKPDFRCSCICFERLITGTFKKMARSLDCSHAQGVLNLLSLDMPMQSTTDHEYHVTQGHLKWKINGFDSNILQDAIQR